MELSKADAAKFLGVSTRALERYTKQGKIGVKYVKAARGKQARYIKSELEELKTNLEAEIHKPTALQQEEQQTPTNIANLAKHPGEESSMFEKYTVSLGLHLANLTQAIQKLPTPPTTSNRPFVPVEEKLLLTLPEVQALTGLSRETLRDAIETGELKAKIIGKAWRIKRDDLEDYIDEL